MTVGILWLFLMVLWIDLQRVIVVFPDHTHFLMFLSSDVSVMETNVSQSPPFFKTSGHHNTLYKAPAILATMKDLDVLDFPELLGTHMQVTVLFISETNCFLKLTKPFLPEPSIHREPEHANTLTSY